MILFSSYSFQLRTGIIKYVCVGRTLVGVNNTLHCSCEMIPSDSVDQHIKSGKLWDKIFYKYKQ